MPETESEREAQALNSRTLQSSWSIGPRGVAIGCTLILLVFVVLAVLVYATRQTWLPAVGGALDISSLLRQADVIVVLGGGDGDRARYAGQLYHQGLSRNLIATGAPVGTDTGAVDLERWGVPPGAIVLANGTQNTYQDALRTRQLMLTHGWHTALLVTDPYHIRRSFWTFRSVFQGHDLDVWPAPVVGGWFHASHWWQSEQGFVAVNDEYLKLVYYIARDQIKISAITAR